MSPYSASNTPDSSVDGSTSVRSHEPRFALISRQPSLLAEICSGSEPSGTRPKPPVDLLQIDDLPFVGVDHGQIAAGAVGHERERAVANRGGERRLLHARYGRQVARAHRAAGDLERPGLDQAAVAVRAGVRAERAQAHERDIRRAIEIVRRQDVGRRAARDRRRQREAQRREAAAQTVGSLGDRPRKADALNDLVFGRASRLEIDDRHVVVAESDRVGDRACDRACLVEHPGRPGPCPPGTSSPAAARSGSNT